MRDLLEKNLKISEENNELLKKMHRTQRLAQIMSISYWVLIIAITFGVYYYLQPYLEAIFGVYANLMGGIEDIQQKSQSFSDTGVFGNILKSLNITK